jgi:hypothetical protein
MKFDAALEALLGKKAGAHWQDIVLNLALRLQGLDDLQRAEWHRKMELPETMTK